MNSSIPLSSRFLLLAISLVTAALSPLRATPVPVTGTMTYTQTFATLGTGSPAWTNDSTIPGWYVQINDGATAPGNAQASDGSSSSLNGLLNLGTAGNADRALGSRATSTASLANIAYAVQFRNTSGSPVQLSQLSYAGELWRTNSTEGGLPETFTVFYAVSSSPVTNIHSGPTAAVAAAGSGFTPFGPAANWASPNNLPVSSALNGNTAVNRAAVSFSPGSVILSPGDYLVIKWTDTNLAGTDGYQGLDDVAVQFTSLGDVPVIAVEQPLSSPVASGNTVDFGKVRVNASDSLIFHIRNAGSADLSSLGVTINGPQAGDFTVTSQPAADVEPGEATDFTVRFTPASAGAKLALLHIASNDDDRSPFDIILTGTAPKAGDVDTDFNAVPDGWTYGACLQPDGKLLLSGDFSKIGSVTRNRLARLNSDGSLDQTFNPNPGSTVQGLYLMADGKMMVAGDFSSIGGASRTYFARLNADGTADPGFNPNMNFDLYALAVQPDGMIIPGGGFSSVNGAPRSHIARFSAAGVLDTGFVPQTSSSVTSVLVQPDGRIIIGGDFTTVNGTSRIQFARLTASGTLDTAFAGNMSESPSCMALQADGKILVGGSFTKVGGPGGATFTHNRLARFDSSGNVDATYNPTADSYISSIAVQADGKVIIGGAFSSVNGVAKSKVARLNANGTLDPTFSAEAAGPLTPAAHAHILPDGQVMLCGTFTSVNGVARTYLARVENDAAVSALTVPSATRVQWLRGGSCPEVQRVDFELLTNGVWTSLGTGTRIAGGWERTGLTLPVSGFVRARALVIQGEFSSHVEEAAPYAFAPEIDVQQPAGVSLVSGSASINFGDLSPGATATRSFVIANIGGTSLTGIDVTVEGANAADFAVSSAPESFVEGGAFTGFEVRFAPAASGSKTATLKISSNDSDENPFSISLQGTLAPSPLENWRLAHFGSTEGTGDAADNADPDMDAVNNLLEFAFGLDPENPASAGLPSWTISDDDISLVFNEPAGMSGITYIAEYNNSLDPESWIAIPNSATLPAHSYYVPAVSSSRLYLRIRVTVP